MSNTVHNQYTEDVELNSEKIDLSIFQGQPELANFPTTSELFSVVFANKMYATMMHNEKGECIDANEKACSIFGYLPGEMNSITVKDIYDINSHHYIEYAQALGNTGKAEVNITCIRKNGERFPCSIRSLVFMDDKGIKQIFTTIYDVSRNNSANYFG